MARLDRVGAALAFDHGGVAEQAGDAGAVEGGAHHQQAQVGAEHALGVEREGEAEVGVEAALVEFVEEDGGDALQAGVVEEACG
jgi:hypothetical protein